MHMDTKHLYSTLCLLLMGVFLVSCSTTRSSPAGTKPSKRDLKGTWEVNDIRFIGKEGLYKADLLDVADSRCFKGSEWVFIPNNNTGTFRLISSEPCPGESHRILWSFFESTDDSYDFQFKYVDQRNRPLAAAKRSGYRMRITELNVPNMELRIKTVDEEGSPFEVVLSFTRVSDNIQL